MSKVKRRVVLKPFDLIIQRADSNYSCIYADLWEITSSDMDTHLEFCRFMRKRNIFTFSNIGEVETEGTPYTFDDGRNSIKWLSQLILALHDIASRGIDVVIELDRRLNLSSPVQDIYEGVTFNTATSKKLIDTYFISVIAFARYIKAPSFVSTRVLNFDNYTYKIINDKVCVNFKY